MKDSILLLIGLRESTADSPTDRSNTAGGHVVEYNLPTWKKIL